MKKRTKIMKITKRTQCHHVCEYIMKHYGEVEGTAIGWIWEQFANLRDNGNPYMGDDCIDLLKEFQAWEAAWIAGAPLPYYNDDGIFCYRIN